MFTVILLQLSAPLTVRMVVTVHLLECVTVQMNGLEVIVKDVSIKLSQMGAGQHAMHLVISYSFFKSYLYLCKCLPIQNLLLSLNLQCHRYICTYVDLFQSHVLVM